MGRIREALNRVYEDRKEIGAVTQAEIAKRLGCNQSTVSQYLSGGRSMSERVIEGFCDVLGVKLSDLENWNPELAKIRSKPVAQESSPTVCRKHEGLFRMLDDILHDKSTPLGNWLRGSIITFHAQWSTGKTPASAGGEDPSESEDLPKPSRRPRIIGGHE